MARTYTARQIAIIRAKTAGAPKKTRSANPDRARGASRQWKARTPKPRTTFVRPEMKHFDFGRTVTVVFVADQEYDQAHEYYFEGTAQMAKSLVLNSIEGIADQIAEHEQDGRIYACIDPYGEDLHCTRGLLVAGSMDDLKVAFDQAFSDI